MPESAKIYPNKGKYSSICLIVNVAEYAWNITYLKKKQAGVLNYLNP